MTTYNLFQSIIYTYVPFPKCFAGNGPLKSIFEINGLDPYVVANGVGRFLHDDSICFLYISGHDESHASLFFENLKTVLQNEPISFCSDSEQIHSAASGKIVVRHRSLNRTFKTEAPNHIVIEFRNTAVSKFLTFTKEDFAAFVYCGNSKEGPLETYKCRDRNNVMCVRRRFTNKKTCGVCFWVPEKNKMKYAILDKKRKLLEKSHSEPLQVPRELFAEYFSDTDTEPIPENDPEYDSDLDF